MDVDKSAKAVTNRLRRASELRDLCLSLAKAGKALDGGSEPSEKAILKPVLIP